MFLPSLLNYFWLMIQVFTAFSLLLPAVLCLFYFARRNARVLPTEDEELHEEKDYAIIVSAQPSPENLPALLRSLMQLNYTNYTVYVAGSRASATGTHLCDEKLIYLRTTGSYHPRFLYRFVIENFRRPHTHIAILDSNSMIDETYLTCLNTFFNQGYQAVTCRQLQEGINSIGNGLQVLINAYRNFFTGRLMFSLGSSAALAGSGAAFTVSCFKACLKTKAESIGFTSMLQMKLAKRHQQVAFASEAVVSINAETTMRQFTAQHAQHVHDWLVCLLSSCKAIIRGIAERNMNKFLSGLFSLQMPLPTGILMGIACLAVNARINVAMAYSWAGVLLLTLLYVTMPAIQAFKQNHQSETAIDKMETATESIALYEPEEEYSVIMQTV